MKKRKFTLFHMSLIPIVQPKLEARLRDSKQEWLQHVFSKRFDFSHIGMNTLCWLPNEVEDGVILGLIQKEMKHERHLSPDDGGGEVSVPEWQGAYVLIDPTKHAMGQRIAVENDITGKPSALVKSLFRAINERDDAPYQIEVDPIFDSSKFWDFAKQNGDVLQKITFDFAVPNMWDTESDLDEDLKETGEVTGAERVVIGLSSEHGVGVYNKIVKEGVSYAERGAGVLTARSFSGSFFSSIKKPVETRISLVKAASKETVMYLLKLKNEVLGYDKGLVSDDTNIDGNGADIN